MEGLTAKVFRTYNASQTFVDQLASTPVDASMADKILAYNRANRMVAVLCNHQKSVSKGHGSAMEKALDKVSFSRFILLLRFSSFLGARIGVEDGTLIEVLCDSYEESSTIE